MVDSAVLGYIGAIVASIFFGSNYVPVKNYPTGNGIAFAWVMSLGTLCTAYVAMFISKTFIFIPSGLLGGSIWAIGNFCVIPIVKTIGLGLGLLLWSCTSIITGFFVGKFGLFGLDKQVVPHPVYNWVGFACIVVAIIFFFFIEPTLEDKKDKEDSSSSVNASGSKRRYSTSYKGSDYSSIIEEDHPMINDYTLSDYNKGNSSNQEGQMIFEKIPPPFKNIFGIVLSVLSGICYGVNMVPMQLWKQTHASDSPLAFIFCHFSGIFLFNTVVFIVYAIIKRPPQVFPQTILPSFLSGALWGIANCGLMVATQILGYTIGFPIGSSGPMIVSSLWSVLYFREIQGKKNLLILLGSFLFLGAGITLLALS
ncbi:transmembrane protein [Tieghemostelium lacteum]|uniref:Transmembrane protein n=1 Tax=Tieghemostelium lacteum TaxID=361077 RepID=A0A152A2X3_TIELA|nr:transmembrane protein [Tieghemostelium lacteum]|eukprot:KYR00559.1 transmembrane protein [Tieghemostelium lacteum]